MWLQFDHVVPHSRGRSNHQENIVVSCAPCNYGKAEYSLDELGLKDPRHTESLRTSWDGLTRLL
ncbi:HNH endonuclease [Ahrensia sp. 13_GOM-1096m]|uniref:HNH endonuclease n=1 Tax=Ahrensia sp. 13_GOM-1096m TaxID=1380380 RepID=UPI003527037D